MNNSGRFSNLRLKVYRESSKARRCERRDAWLSRVLAIYTRLSRTVYMVHADLVTRVFLVT